MSVSSFLAELNFLQNTYCTKIAFFKKNSGNCERLTYGEMDVSCEMLLHPELLSSEQLLFILKQRRLNIPNLENMARDDLLDIFHQYCVPYGQRKYRDSGRGKMLNKTRQISPEPVVKLNTFANGQSRKSTNYPDRSERLKPPPDLLSGHLKRIKLDIKSQVVSNVNNWKRKMSVDAVVESPPPKKDRKPITWP